MGNVMNVRDVIKLVEEDGWYYVYTRGNHRNYLHPTKKGKVTIAGKLSKDVPPEILKSILKQAQDRKAEVMIYPILVVIEKGETSYGAYAPDLPGCIAVGDTREETEQLMYEALQEHIEWMLEDGDFVPEQPSTAVSMIVPAQEGTRPNQFLAIIQQRGDSFHADVPKLEGCAAEGATPGEVEQRIYEAIQDQAHVMQQNQEQIPDNTLSAMYMAIPVSVREKVAAL